MDRYTGQWAADVARAILRGDDATAAKVLSIRDARRPWPPAGFTIVHIMADDFHTMSYQAIGAVYTGPRRNSFEAAMADAWQAAQERG